MTDSARDAGRDMLLMLDENTVRRLGRVLALLAFPHDGEALSARAAYRILYVSKGVAP